MILRCIALIASFTNILVFSSSTLKEQLYRWLLIISISNALYSGLLILTTIVCYRNGAALISAEFECDLISCNVLSVLFIIMAEYFTSCLAILNIFIEMYLTAQRICIITAKRVPIFKREYLKYVCSAFVATSFLIYSPLLLMNEVELVEHNHTYKHQNRDYHVAKTEFSKSKQGIMIVNSLNIFRIFLVCVALLGLNLTALIKYRIYFRRKFSLTETKSKFKSLYF
jgi:hypothetical protein